MHLLYTLFALIIKYKKVFLESGKFRQSERRFLFNLLFKQVGKRTPFSCPKGDIKMDSVIQFRGTIYENGYGLLAQKVMRDKTLPKQSKLIYAYMCSFASINTENGERTAFPSVSLQCSELGMNQDTYYKWRKPLVDKGLITIEKRKTDGRFDRNIYYIEAVPVPQDTNSEPHPKNSGMEKTSTEKTGTIINSSNSNSFNNNKDIKIDDDKRTSPSVEDSAVQDEMNLIISNLRDATKEELTDRSFNSVVRKVVDKHQQGKVISFRDYLTTALIKKIEDLEYRRDKDKAQQDFNEAAKAKRDARIINTDVTKKVVFYNWLDERE